MSVYLVQTANITVSPCKGVTADGVAGFSKDWPYGSAVDLHPDDAVSLLRVKAVTKVAAMPEASEKTPELVIVEQKEAAEAAAAAAAPVDGEPGPLPKTSRSK